MLHLAPLYPFLYHGLSRLFPACLWQGSPDTPAIALTFDDGPHPEYTPQLLEVLDQYQVKATFFCLGVCAYRYPSILQEIYHRGHWIALHGYTHESFPFLKIEQLQQSLRNTQQAIADVCSLEPAKIRDVRPPNGLFTPKILQHLQLWEYRPVMWTVVPEDWVDPGIPVVCQRTLTQVRNGSLIVLHDGYYGGQQVTETVRRLIPQLLDKGYHFVTIDDLWTQKSQKGVFRDSPVRNRV